MELRQDMYAIETSKLTKYYSTNVVALVGVDLHVADQEIFGMLGPNGAGKTTTVKMLTTLIRPTAGSALVGGFDVVRESTKVRRIIGYLPQQLTSDDTITGYENLLFYAKLYNLRKEERSDRIHESLALVGLSQWANDMVSTYSGGMKRRLELASVLVSRPRILFLDEPTLGLDPRSRALIWDFLRKLRDDFATTIFLTTNYMDEADKLCDRVAIIDTGKVIIDGSPSKLKESIGGEFITLKVKPAKAGCAVEPEGIAFNEDEQKILCTNCRQEISYHSDYCRCGQRITWPDDHERREIERVLRHHPYLRVAEHADDGTKLVIIDGMTGEKVIPSLLAELRAEGVEVLSVTLQKPNLDEVFTAYTGKDLVREAPMSGPKKKDQRAVMLRALRLD